MKTTGESGTGGRKQRRVMLFLLPVVIVLLLLVITLPYLASTGPARRAILGAVRGKVVGTVDVESWSLRWLGGLEFVGLVYDDPQAGVALRAERISTTSGLLKLMGREKDLGTVEILRPDLVYTPPPVEPDTLEADGGAKGRPGPEVKPERSGEAPGKGGLARSAGAATTSDVKGHLRLVDGRIRCPASGQRPPVELDDVQLSLQVDSLNEPVDFRLRAAQSGGGTLEMDGRLKVFDGGAPAFERAAGTVKVSVSDFDLSAGSALAAGLGSDVEISGLLTASLASTVDGPDRWQAQGQAAVHDLKLAGGPLGQDKPHFDAVTCELDISRSGSGFVIKRLQLESPVLTAAAGGNLTPGAAGVLPSGFLNGRAEVNLAALAKEFPSMLRLKPDVVVRGGTVSVGGNLDASPDRIALGGRLEMVGVSAELAGRPVTLDQPVVADVDGIWTRDGITVNKLKLTSGFAEASGSGTPDALSLAFSADLAAALREAGKFLDLGDLRVAGRLRAQAEVKSIPAQTGGRARDVSVQVSLKDLKIDGLAPGTIAQQSLEASVAAAVRTEDGGKLLELSTVKVALTTDLLGADVTAERIVWAKGSPAVEGLDATVRTALGEIMRFGRDSGWFKPKLDAEGLLTLGGQVSGGGQTWQGRPLSAKLTDGVLSLPDGQRIKIPNADVSLRSEVTPERVAIERLEVASDALNLECAGRIEDLAGSRMVDVQGHVQLDLAWVNSLLEPLSGVKLDIQGKGRQPFSLRTPLSAGDWAATLRQTTADIGLYIERLSLFGMTTGVVEPRLVVRDSVARLTIETEINEGRLSLSPFIDATREPAMLAISNRTDVIKDMKLTDEMASQLLARFHPILIGSTVVGGRIGLRLDTFEGPLGPDFSRLLRADGRLSLKGVALTPQGVVQETVKLLKLKSDRLVLPDQDIAFSCRDGRITPSPLSVTVDGHIIGFAGSVGVDGSLDYVAETLVTEAMVGADVYRYVKDAKLKIPIRGSASRPRIAHEALDASLSALVTQAGKNLIKEKGGKFLTDLLKQVQ